MGIQIIKEAITRKELIDMAKKGFGDLVKAVIDIDQKIMAMGGEMHADEEAVLMEKEGSQRKNTWGVNLYPKEKDLIEYDSIINIKPFYGNQSRNIEDEKVREEIKDIVCSLIKD